MLPPPTRAEVDRIRGRGAAPWTGVDVAASACFDRRALLHAYDDQAARLQEVAEELAALRAEIDRLRAPRAGSG